MIQKIKDENVSLAFQVSSLVKEREHIKLEYKKMYDSIKKTQAKIKLQTNSLQQKLNDQNSKNNKLRAQLKGKFSESQTNQHGTSVNTKLSNPPTSRTKLYSVTPLPKSKVIPKVVKKNDFSKSVNSYLNTKKIIQNYTKVLARGLLKIETEPINVYFKNNRAAHRDYLKVTKEYVATLQELLDQARELKPLDKHIGRVSSTNASESKPKSNTKNDRIPQPSSKSKKNKVDAYHKKFKYSANKNNHVSDCNANVKNVSLSKNSDTICLSCNECLFSANHDACVVKYLKKMQKHKVAKSAKQKLKIVVVVQIGRRWFGMVQFRNDHFVAIMGYRDLQMWNILIPHVYYVEGLGHNLFSVGQFCDSDLEVAFRKHTCFVRNLEGVDLQSGSHDSNIYTISMANMMKSSLICLLFKASKASRQILVIATLTLLLKLRYHQSAC
ncbi:hypothetical protein Tco_0816371 [Tanacetum coccineum]